MRHCVHHLGLAVIGVLAVAMGCGGEEPDNTMVAPSGTGTGTTSAPTGTGGTSSAGTSTGATSTAGTSTGGATTAATSAEPSGPSFTTDIYPIFTAKCAGNSCHGDTSFYGKLAASTADAAYDAVLAISSGVGRISERIGNGQMPMTTDGTTIAYGCATGGMQDTSKAECLSAAELELINTWVDAGGPE